MEASFVDLRRKSAEIIKALTRKERVTVLYRGKPAAIMEPIDDRVGAERQRASEHAVFGIWRDQAEAGSVDEHVAGLRRRRFHDL
ncbi:MAG: type II toxin-antitoxin system prevent-host-death family antitoxin [Salinisphaeraceae bacterium]|jgi:antitoxin (DNA-binding transcriptional repressor) of toxin-antitoxin stability system|nr:type II toxin-antitoxin system prevent-host-death family antitoxin [Salinisphaeraceae bacterium]